jgi:hypothetical protein
VRVIVVVEVNGTNNDGFNPDDGSNSLNSSDGAKHALLNVRLFSKAFNSWIRSAKLLTHTF